MAASRSATKSNGGIPVRTCSAAVEVVLYPLLICKRCGRWSYTSAWDEMAENVNHSIIKVAVIGAGVSGLCAGRHLISEPEKFQFDIFEQQDNVGGTWRYSPRVGTDEYGLSVHSSMYKNLKTNLPKEVMAFPDFPFPGCGGQSYLHHTALLRYLEEYAKHYGLYQHIKFHTLVENVEPLEHSNCTVEWFVDIRDAATNERARFVYDAVMVCNGHYSVPHIPEIPGLDTFEGLLMHNHDYREESKFQNMKVVILGAGVSGNDITIHISNVAKE
ncbi:senecionine N-oxygenase-like, partial [Stegodyphus dumicola]|uniref:senecionine N-oxygenase-like n=1 Tax=Stegodyphus dumicola TaxID=202533 RepID=UPI0015A9DE32